MTTSALSGTSTVTDGSLVTLRCFTSCNLPQLPARWSGLTCKTLFSEYHREELFKQFISGGIKWICSYNWQRRKVFPVFFVNITKFRCLESTSTNHSICEVKERWNACFFSSEYFIFLSSIESWALKHKQEHYFVYCFYGCYTQSLTLTDEYRMKVFENRMPRGETGSERE